MNILQAEGNVVLPGFFATQPFSLAETLCCGQSFRFSGDENGRFTGVVAHLLVDVKQVGDDLVFYDVTPLDFHQVLLPYFDLERDYAALQQTFSKNPVLGKAIAYAPGIRVLQQNTWEALCTFLFSQNNNIKRIQGIVARFCSEFGDELAPGIFAFPSPEKIAGLSLGEMEPIRAGFRAKYILDAGQKVADGRVDLSLLPAMPLAEARDYLMTINGVGPKVADCVLLFGAGHMAAFPRDVWINRAMDHLFPRGLPAHVLPNAGIAQQYIFHYIRTGADTAHLREKPKK